MWSGFLSVALIGLLSVLGTEEGASEHDRTPSGSYGSGVVSKACTSVSTGRGGR
jgi:hypothetical protein